MGLGPGPHVINKFLAKVAQIMSVCLCDGQRYRPSFESFLNIKHGAL